MEDSSPYAHANPISLSGLQCLPYQVATLHSTSYFNDISSCLSQLTTLTDSKTIWFLSTKA